jgi:hypothetical protein
MTITLKFVVIVNFVVWRKASKAMHFPKCANMEQQKKKFAKALDVFPLILLNLICKNE